MNLCTHCRWYINYNNSTHCRHGYYYPFDVPTVVIFTEKVRKFGQLDQVGLRLPTIFWSSAKHKSLKDVLYALVEATQFILRNQSSTKRRWLICWNLTYFDENWWNMTLFDCIRLQMTALDVFGQKMSDLNLQVKWRHLALLT